MDGCGAALGRRALLTGAGGFALVAAAPGQPIKTPALGDWTDGPHGLPAYRYTGPLTFGGAPLIPDDPWFLLGNQRLTLFVHASGKLRFLNGQRGWACMNGGGLNRASLLVDGNAHSLAGLAAPASMTSEKLFAPGSARFAYAIGGIEAVRSLAVPPSRDVGDGPCAVLATVSVRNARAVACRIAYREQMTGNFRPVWPPGSNNDGRVRYERTPHLQDGVASVATRAVAGEALSLPPRPEISELDADPPTLWMAPVGAGLTATADGCEIGVAGDFVLAPGEARVLRFAFGASFVLAETEAARARFAAAPPGEAPFAPDWAAILPPLAHEKDAQTRREMRWNAATLEAMATWREYYGETVVPQGTTYDYEWGFTGWTRDVAQHALPLCRTNPALARSVLRYIFKRTTAEGEIKLGDSGFGWVPPGPWVTSDQQLYAFFLAAEYLAVTGDARILDDAVDWYPRGAGEATGLEHLTRCFVVLRDRIGTGAHGLVKLLNSDWNDMFYAVPKPLPYAELFGTAESHLNSALAIVVLGRLAHELSRLSAAGAPLAAAMTSYRTELLRAFLADLGSREFPRRAYLGRAEAVGDIKMWLEPAGYTLMIPELSDAARRALVAAFEARLLAGEPLGPRQIEDPAPEPGLPAGSRENGGVWWSLTGAVGLGLASTDPGRARVLVARMGFANFAGIHPGVWTGAWSAADCLDSARLPTAGLSVMQPWCAHAHAWPLHAYLTLAAQSTG